MSVRTLYVPSTVLFLLTAACQTPPVPTPEFAELGATGLAAEDLEWLIQGERLLPESPPNRLAEADAVALTLRHSSRLRAALAHVRAAAAEAEQARAWPNPLLSIVLRLPEGGGQAEWDVGIGVALQNLLTRGGRLEVADAELQAAAAVALATALDEAAAARSAFARAILGERHQEILERRLRNAGARYELLARSAAAGETGAAAVRSAVAARAQLRGEISGLEAEILAARLELASLLGLAAPAADWEWIQPETPRHDPPRESWLEGARSNHPVVLQAQWSQRAIEAEAAIAGATLRNSLEAGIAAERDGEWSAGPGVVAALPLSSSGKWRRAAAVARAQAAAHETEQAEREVLRATGIAWDAWRLASDERDRLTEAELAKEQRWRASEIAHERGEIGTAALLDAEDGWLDARSARIKAELQVLLQRARLVRDAGGIPALTRDASR